MSDYDYDEAVVRAVLDRKVIVLPTLQAQMWVMRRFCGEDATEGVLDAEFLWSYLWEPYFKLHGNEPCDLYDSEGYPIYL